VYFENLVLEIYATKAGLEVIKPARCQGTSGIEHRFSFLTSEGPRMYAFDVYPEVGEVEVIRTYLKRMDTGAETFLVCLKGRPTAAGSRLASEYGLRVLGPADVEVVFDSIRTPASNGSGTGSTLLV